jgi:hypothetical protein
VFTTTTRAKERRMDYSISLVLTLAIAIPKLPTDPIEEKDRTPDLDEVLNGSLRDLRELVEAFLTEAVTPTGTHEFERNLQERLREVGRKMVQYTYNRLEPAAVDELPKHAQFQGDCYTRLNRKT